jgi:RNA polymerase sigma-70 factor (ECF subfamily)
LKRRAELQSANEEDAMLIARVRDGDRNALTGLYERYSSVMLGLGVRILGARAEAEDVLHDVLVEAWKKAATYDETRGTVRSWLLLRMRSRCLDRKKSPRLARGQELDEATERKLEAPAAKEPKLGTERRILREALDGLTEDQRRPLELVYFEGRSIAEVAEALSLPVGTVKSRMNGARKALRGALVAGGITA